MSWDPGRDEPDGCQAARGDPAQPQERRGGVSSEIRLVEPQDGPERVSYLDGDKVLAKLRLLTHFLLVTYRQVIVKHLWTGSPLFPIVY